VRSLPVDGESVVLRTLTATDEWPDADARWHYNVQGMQDFHGRLVKASSVRAMMLSRQLTTRRGLTLLGLSP
jgi:hypothetical protein